MKIQTWDIVLCLFGLWQKTDFYRFRRATTDDYDYTSVSHEERLATNDHDFYGFLTNDTQNWKT